MSDFFCEIFNPTSHATVVVLRLKGNLDSFSLPGLELKIKDAIQQGQIHFVVNCEKLKFLSSPGMGLFLGTLGELEKQNGKIVFTHIDDEEVRDAMDMIGFFDVFKVYADEEEAIQKIGEEG